jgi:hypothetical protein
LVRLTDGNRKNLYVRSAAMSQSDDTTTKTGTPTTPDSASTAHSGRRLAIPSLVDADLRDYFAAQVLANAVLAPYVDQGGWNEHSVAANAYAIADAMLRARSK